MHYVTKDLHFSISDEQRFVGAQFPLSPIYRLLPEHITVASDKGGALSFLSLVKATKKGGHLK